MSMIRSSQGASWLPEDFGSALDIVVQAKSVAANASTVFSTSREKVGFPLWVADPSVAWYSELSQLSLTDGSTSEVVVTPTKTAGFTVLSNELVADSDPSVAAQVAQGLANQIAQAIDTAYFSNTTSNGPNGLLSLAATTVDSGSSVTNLDPFIAARYKAELNGAKLTHFLVNPSVAQTISQLKTASGYNTSLLSFVDDGVQIAGIPVITSIHVDAATTAWGVDASQQRYVLRQGTSVETFPYIDHDGTYVRAISRIGFGFLNPAGVIRIAGNASVTITVLGSPTGGTYTVLVNGNATSSIAYNATAATVKAAIVAADSGLTASDVTVTGSGPYSVTAPATLTHGTDSLTGGTTPTTTVA